MLSYHTTSAFVDHGTQHPAMKWMEDYTVNAIDVKGGEQAGKAVAELYGRFTAHLHEPFILNVTRLTTAGR